MEASPHADRPPQVLSAGITKQVQTFSPLPYVADEMSAIGRLYAGRKLMDDRFDAANLQDALARTDYRILHIASHGKFGNSVEDAYILTYREHLDLNRFTRLVERAGQDPANIELLVLSACDTAAGDDQATLGLAGMALRAGIRRVVASLWAADDSASARLIEEFYSQLKRNPGIPVAEALGRAQRTMIESEPFLFRHPGFWAPFLLIDNSM